MHFSLFGINFTRLHHLYIALLYRHLLKHSVLMIMLIKEFWFTYRFWYSWSICFTSWSRSKTEKNRSWQVWGCYTKWWSQLCWKVWIHVKTIVRSFSFIIRVISGWSGFNVSLVWNFSCCLLFLLCNLGISRLDSVKIPLCILVILNHVIFPGFSRFFHYLGSIKLDFKSMQDTCALRSVLMIHVRFAFNN